MRQDIFDLLTAADLAQIVLGWLLVIGCIIYACSKRDNQ